MKDEKLLLSWRAVENVFSRYLHKSMNFCKSATNPGNHTNMFQWYQQLLHLRTWTIFDELGSKICSIWFDTLQWFSFSISDHLWWESLYYDGMWPTPLLCVDMDETSQPRRPTIYGIWIPQTTTSISTTWIIIQLKCYFQLKRVNRSKNQNRTSRNLQKRPNIRYSISSKGHTPTRQYCWKISREMKTMKFKNITKNDKGKRWYNTTHFHFYCVEDLQAQYLKQLGRQLEHMKSYQKQREMVVISKICCKCFRNYTIFTCFMHLSFIC